VNLGKVCLTCK